MSSSAAARRNLELLLGRNYSAIDFAALCCPCGGPCVPIDSGDGYWFFDGCGRRITCAHPDCERVIVLKRHGSAYCSKACCAEVAALRKLEHGATIDAGYSDPESYLSRIRRPKRLLSGVA